MKYLAFLLPILLSACYDPVACKYRVGDTVKTVAGETYVIQRAFPGDTGGREPRYILTAGKGWRIGFEKDGIRMARGTYDTWESEIAEVVK